MKKKIMMACLAFALIFPAVCFAEEDMTSGIKNTSTETKNTTAEAKKKTPGSGPNPFSDCGIGAALFPTIKPLAVSSNVIWDLGSTGMTSATASPETCNGKNVEAAAFILKNYDSLAEETARGKGEYLTSLMNIMEVNEGERIAVINNIRTQMANTISNDTYLAIDQVQKANIYYTFFVGALNSNAS